MYKGERQMNEQKIKLELTVEEVNTILTALAARPYYEVAELIGKIQTEGETQITEVEKAQ